MQVNDYYNVAKFINDATDDDLRTFFLDILKFHPETVIHVLNYGDGAWMEEVMVQLREVKKINAIKIYRQYTGLSLKAAKDAVELIIDEHFPLWPATGVSQ